MVEKIKYINEDFVLDKLPKDQQERCAKLYEIPLSQLIERYSKSQTYGENGKVLNDDYWDIPIVLHDLLHIAEKSEINEIIESIEKRFESLEAKLRNHRHELSKNFSAKPEF